MATDTRRRVKLYALNAERQWDDRGTGHVSSNYVDRLKGISLLVRAEADGSLLLESKIQPDTAYQKQQDTLIVWSEGDNFDLALSFQEKAGCDEIWEKICIVSNCQSVFQLNQLKRICVCVSNSMLSFFSRLPIRNRMELYIGPRQRSIG